MAKSVKPAPSYPGGRTLEEWRKFKSLLDLVRDQTRRDDAVIKVGRFRSRIAALAAARAKHEAAT